MPHYLNFPFQFQRGVKWFLKKWKLQEKLSLSRGVYKDLAVEFKDVFFFLFNFKVLSRAYFRKLIIKVCRNVFNSKL